MFSIVIPTYNCEKYVEESIKSVLHQTFHEFQLIIVDDGSSDRTFQISKEIADKDSRVEIYQLNHGGVSVARNFGVSKAKYEFILFLDCDDKWDRELLQKCFSFCMRYEMILFGICEEFYDNDIFLYSKNSMESKEEKNIEKKLMIKMFNKYNMFSPCNKIYRKEIINKFNLRFSTQCVYLEDLKFNLDYLYHINSLFILNQDLYFYRLSVNEKQILKRDFYSPYLNEDELYFSMNQLSLKLENKSCEKTSPFREILLDAYLKEAFYYISTKNKMEQKKYIIFLNENEKFLKLIKCVNGKFIKLLRFFITFKLYYLEKYLINWRFNYE